MALQDHIHSPRPRLDITQDLIDEATRQDSGHCVIADAIKSLVKGASNVSVDLATIRWTDREAGVRYVYLTPIPAQQLLLSFDYGMPIEPQQIRMGFAAQVVEVTAKNKVDKAKAVDRRATLEAKEAAGEALTQAEARSLRSSRAAEAARAGRTTAELPTSEGSPELHYVGDSAKRTIKVGGRAPGTAVLRHGQGRRRVYGLRAAGVPNGMPRPPMAD